jgi:hypothetical protein
MSRLRTASLLAGLVTLALAGVGCKQGIGDRCEQNSDCSDGLACDYAGMTTAEAGKCYDPNARTTDAATQDVATTNDAEDTAPDQADDSSSADASDDVPQGSDGATDGGTPPDDGGTPDAAGDAAVD